MEKAVGYEQRRRIRAQIREMKKLQDEKNNKNVRKKSPVRISPRDQKVIHQVTKCGFPNYRDPSVSSPLTITLSVKTKT